MLSRRYSWIIVLCVLAMLFAGCASGGEALEESRPGLREGELSFSPGQRATFRGTPDPELLRLWDDFEKRIALGESFVVADTGGANRYLRLDTKGSGYVHLVSSDGPNSPGFGDSRIRDFRLTFDLRLSENGILEVQARKRDDADGGVFLLISESTVEILDVPDQSNRYLAKARVALGEEWHEAEFRLSEDTGELFVDGESVIRSVGLRQLHRGGILLEYTGRVDIDNLRLYSQDSEAPGEEARALLIEELEDDFSEAELAPWWRIEGNGGVDVGVTGGGARLLGSEEYRTVSGISTRALFSGTGRVRASFYDPPERTSFSLGIGKVGIEDSLVLGVQESGITLIQYGGGAGRQLVRRALAPETWSSRGQQEVVLTVSDGVLYASLNGTPLLSYSDRADLFRGTLFFGYLGHYPRTTGRTLRSVEVSPRFGEEFDPSLYPSGQTVKGAEGTEALPDYQSVDSLFASFDGPGAPRFFVGANESSVAGAEIVLDEEAQEGHLLLDFTMKEGNGLHANVGFSLERDLSSYGGVAFRARAEGIERAHISMSERTSGVEPDRINAFFSVGPEWREYRLPFSREYFALSADHLLGGSDGVFDFAHVDWMLFEVYNYEGPGTLHIDDIRFLPAGARQRFTNRITVENFEPADRHAPYGLETHTYAHGNARAEFSEGRGRGARGSSGFGRFRAEKGIWEYAELGFWGDIPTDGYGGVGLSLRGEGVSTTELHLHELEPESAQFRPVTEAHHSRLPLSEEWVEWRLPFMPGAMEPAPYSDLTNGSLDGWLLQAVSFSYPEEFEGRGTEVQIDELFLFEKGRDRSLRVGLFRAEPEEEADPRVSQVIDSVLQLNLGRLEGYEVSTGLRGPSREEAFARAAEGQLDFFLRPSYRRDQDELLLSLELCNVPAGAVSKRIQGTTVVGLDIFHDLDLLSTAVLNTLADTNLAFEDHLTRTEGAGSTVWADSLERIEPYWLEFDGVAARVTEGLLLSPASQSTETEATDEGRGPSFDRPMVLSEPYLTGVERLSAKLGEGSILLWNYCGREVLNLLEITGEEVTVEINGTTTRFALPSSKEGSDSFWEVVLDLTGDGYRVLLDGQELGVANGYNVPFGRVGLAVAGDSARFRDLEVRFRE